MEETTFVADPMRLMIAALAGIIVLLVLIIRFKLHPVLSMMISAIIIGIGAGMPLTMISDTVEKGVGKTLQGIALMFFEKNKFFQRVGWCSGRNHFYRNSEGVNRNLLQEFAKLVARSGRTCIRIPDPPTGKNAAF